jgi:predicted RNase H-like nuclease (RuvC/YqgF family)
MLPELQKEIGADLRPTLERVREELQGLETRLSQVQGEREKKISDVIQGYEEEKENTEKRLNDLKKGFEEMKVRLKQERVEMENEFRVSLFFLLFYVSVSVSVSNLSLCYVNREIWSVFSRRLQRF